MASLEMEIKNLSFSYPGEEVNALTELDLSIEEGSFVVLCGPSGSGKTTLLRTLKKEIRPPGRKTGSIFYRGEDLELLDPLRSTSEIGMVFQDPENQIVLDTVIQELAFALENQGLDSEIIKKRTAEIVTFFGLEDSLDKLIHELSGGQKQIVNLCSVLMLRPRVLLLDEPTSQLDPIGAKQFLKMLFDLNQEFSLTVILSEHRLEEVFPLADKIVYLEEGRIKHQGSPKQFCKAILEREGERESTNKNERKNKGKINNEETGAFEFLPALARMHHNLQKKQGLQEASKLQGAHSSLNLVSLEDASQNTSESASKDGNNMDRHANQTSEIRAEQIPLTVREAKQFLKANQYLMNLLNKQNQDSSNTLKYKQNTQDSSAIKNRSKTSNTIKNKSKISNLAINKRKTRKSTPLLECKDLYFKYNLKSSLVLKDLCLTIERGEFLAILGANGSGKSTLLKALAGLIRPQKGNIYLGGKKLKKISDQEVHQQIGYIAQNPLLHFTTDTVEAELASNLGLDVVDNTLIKNVSTTSADNNAFNLTATSLKEQLITLFELGDLLSRHPYDLSGGQQQKLAIACVLLTNPDILLLDEPTKGLDPISKLNLIELLNQLQEEGLTILMSTHDLEFAAKYASRCTLLFAGEISYSGSPREFFTSNYYYTTAINRALRDYLPEALTEMDVTKWL